jgi:hypothetical protein
MIDGHAFSGKTRCSIREAVDDPLRFVIAGNSFAS